MSTLTMCVGLPGSGKSTWAIEQVAQNKNTVRVNRDSLRAMQDPTKWTPKFERDVRGMRDTLIHSLLTAGKNVINDDTNLSPRHEREMRKIAEDHGVEFCINASFMEDVTVEECIRRDVQRKEGRCGKDVIERMYYEYWSHKTKPENTGLKNAILCDLDGTLCNLPPGMSYPKAFNRDYRGDLCAMPVSITLDAFKQGGDMGIILLSGRFSERRDETLEWLANYNIPYTQLLMRPIGDRRPDTVVKKELYMGHVQGKFFVPLVLDDRPSVVRMWRAELGLNVFQVAPNLEF